MSTIAVERPVQARITGGAGGAKRVLFVLGGLDAAGLDVNGNTWTKQTVKVTPGGS